MNTTPDVIEWDNGKPRRRRGARAAIIWKAEELRRVTPEDRHEKGRGGQHLAALRIPAFPDKRLQPVARPETSWTGDFPQFSTT